MNSHIAAQIAAAQANARRVFDEDPVVLSDEHTTKVGRDLEIKASSSGTIVTTEVVDRIPKEGPQLSKTPTAAKTESYIAPWGKPNKWPGNTVPKLDKAAVLYMPPTVLNPGESPTGASCGKCALRCTTVKGDECAVVFIDGTADTRVNYEKGVCGLYIGGSRELVNFPVPTVPRSAAGYIESARAVPSYCGRCEYFEGGDNPGGTASCKKVEGLVAYFGCCNLYERG
jgi:hypothetical protein